MRLVVVNPNTSESSTEAFVELAEAAASPGTTITGATGPFGVDLMRRPAELAIGVHAMLEAVAARIDDHDAVIIAAFGDYGAEAAADLFRKPVMTIAEAVFSTVRLARCRYSILAPAPAFSALLGKLPAAYGAQDSFIGIHAVRAAPSDPDYPEKARAALEALLAADHPGAVIPVGPPLSAIVDTLRGASSVPLLEGVTCAVRLCETVLSLGLSGPWPGTPTSSAKTVSGGAPPLARLLAQ